MRNSILGKSVPLALVLTAACGTKTDRVSGTGGGPPGEIGTGGAAVGAGGADPGTGGAALGTGGTAYGTGGTTPTTGGTAYGTGGTAPTTGGTWTTGGIENAGGLLSTGGSENTGGLLSTGGSQGTGGTPGTGGTSSTGGIESTGGSPTTGGADPGTGTATGRRQMERLGRGLVALNRGDGEVYIGWRLLGHDPNDISFNLYRTTGSAAPVKLNDQPILQSTDYTDTGVDTAQSNTYVVRSVIDGQETAESQGFTLPANAPERNYISIPLQGGYVFGRGSVGDLDGDGEYDYVIKQPNQVTDPGVWSRPTDTYKLEAYRSDGSFMWRVDLGWNIVQGVWWSPMLVYDLDGDGKAEVVSKTAPTDVDYRNSDGRVLEGPEYFSVFDGETGSELVREDWIPRGQVSDWGDSYGNRVNRNLMAVAYLDGARPSLVIFRGTYELMKAEAWDYRDGNLTWLWEWSHTGGGGFHNIRVGDIDGDGRDEIINGSIALDDDGSEMWNTGEGHGDKMHLSDIDPDRPGLELFSVQETPGDYEHPVHLRDARSGDLIWGPVDDSWGDVGRGMAADVNPEHKGLECWGSAGNLFSATGENLGTRPSSNYFAVWWDDDLLRELVENGSIAKFDHTTGRTEQIGSAQEYRYADKLVADVFGDWREEIFTVPESGGELRIYTTTIPSTRRFYTMMHDPIYRVDVATMGMGYTQSAQPSFYLGEGMDTPPRPDNYYAGE